MRRIIKPLMATCLSVAASVVSFAVAAEEACDAACLAARKAQDPLAPVTAVFTDNTFTFDNSGGNQTANYQIQPVYSIDFGETGHLILRGVINYNSVPSTPSDITGFSDTILQAFWVPNTKLGPLSIGFGPQVSVQTRENPALAGLGDGLGLAAVAFGFAGDLSYGGIIGHIRGENDVNVTTIQPIVFYNTEFLGGSYFGYNNTIAYNDAAPSGSQWTVPIGLTAGKTWAQPNGGAIDFNIGYYYLVEAAAGANKQQFKFGLSYIFP
ncbi:hypothetical protein BXY66_1560 [Shimia isoporae]|uniref:Outer membrane beta-barrel porin/alpha-amylase n=1 Tax=Shimia isoporae TaxID=647720 RepID=A0A4R1NNV1_9RHOB|nr:hypothetical protein [Shimia isoporae]TCL09511.1 hypothetical protein BXY66_1560 [Shimia isoporae]